MTRGPTLNTSHKWLNIPDTELSRYNCYDTLATALGWQMLTQAMETNGQWQYYKERVRPFVPAVLEMQTRGLRIDTAELQRLRTDLGQELADTEAKVRSVASCPYTLNLNSPPQRAQFLYDEVGFKVPPATRKRPARSTNQDALLWILKGLRKSDPRELLEQMFHRSRLNTILTRYLTLDVDPDGRIRPRIKLTGAETGRLAYADPAVQQWPREIRTLVVAAPGHTLVAADYSQIEARILAKLSGDRVSLEVFHAGGDVHAANAQDLFAVSPGAWADLPAGLREEYRNFAKTFLYGISYGGSPETMHTKTFCPCPQCAGKVPPTAKMTTAQVTAAANRWFAHHQPVVQWRDALVADVRRTHTYTTPCGRKRYFCEPYPAFVRPLMNFPMQATAADIINEATVRLHHIHAAPIVLQHHDMLTLEVPTADVPRWAQVLRTEMERPVPELGGMVFPVDMKRGDSWGRMEKIPATT